MQKPYETGSNILINIKCRSTQYEDPCEVKLHESSQLCVSALRAHWSHCDPKIMQVPQERARA